MMLRLPVGKLPHDLLERLLAGAPAFDSRLILGPGIGLDCAIVDMGDRYLAWKADPITFATDEIGWYAVQVNANDLATCGATPRWLLVTLLLPEGSATEEMAEAILSQVYQACAELEISVLGGHTEITHGLERPLLAAAMVGEVEKNCLITPQGAQPGDRLLLTKGVPVEATAILARELPQRLENILSPEELQQAAGFLHRPGIGVLREARLAVEAGGVTAMHDPTEGGLAGALWELAHACQHTLVVNTDSVPIPPLSKCICTALGLDPLAAIASGALLLAVRKEKTTAVCRAIQSGGIDCAEIGWVEEGPPAVWDASTPVRRLLNRPERDEIARLFSAL